MSLTNITELIILSRETQIRHPELFHYTNRDAFENIVKSNTLWAFHYAEMEDTTEVVLLRDELQNALKQRYDVTWESLNPNWHIRRCFEATGGTAKLAKDFVDELYGATFLSKAGFGALDAFLVSFSTHADDGECERENGLASQWKGYAKSSGFCLVFDTSKMGQHLGLEMDARYWVRQNLAPVRYFDAPIETLFPELLDASADTLRQFLSGTQYPEMAVPEFLAGSTLLKGVEFRPEREVRIVAIPGTKRLSEQAAKEHPQDFKVLPLPEVLTRPGSTRRYTPLFDGLGLKLPLKRVIAGPGPKQHENVALARSLVGDVPVFCSSCEVDWG